MFSQMSFLFRKGSPLIIWISIDNIRERGHGKASMSRVYTRPHHIYDRTHGEKSEYNIKLPEQFFYQMIFLYSLNTIYLFYTIKFTSTLLEEKGITKG